MSKPKAKPAAPKVQAVLVPRRDISGKSYNYWDGEDAMKQSFRNAEVVAGRAWPFLL